MQYLGKPIDVYVHGEFACFTRPECGVERVSYQVPTASAARGILEAIFGKPEFKWVISEVELLKPIKTIAVKRNEVKSKAPVRLSGPMIVNDNVRTQRNSVLLKDVAYRIRAQVYVPSSVNLNNDNDPYVKYRSVLERRLELGQCFRQPYFGCREFIAYFSNTPPDIEPLSIPNGSLGKMLLEVAFNEQTEEAFREMFDAKIENNIVKYPVDQIINFWECVYAVKCIA